MENRYFRIIVIVLTVIGIGIFAVVSLKGGHKENDSVPQTATEKFKEDVMKVYIDGKEDFDWMTFEDLICEGVFSKYQKINISLIEKTVGKSFIEDKTTLYYRKGSEKAILIDVKGKRNEELLSYIIDDEIMRCDIDSFTVFTGTSKTVKLIGKKKDYGLTFDDEGKIIQIFTSTMKEADREYWYFIDETIEQRLGISDNI